MSFDHADLEGLVFLVFSIPSGSNTLSASFSSRFPEPWGEGFDGDGPFRDCPCRLRTGITTTLPRLEIYWASLHLLSVLNTFHVLVLQACTSVNRTVRRQGKLLVLSLPHTVPDSTPLLYCPHPQDRQHQSPAPEGAGTPQGQELQEQPQGTEVLERLRNRSVRAHWGCRQPILSHIFPYTKPLVGHSKCSSNCAGKHYHPERNAYPQSN